MNRPCKDCAAENVSTKRPAPHPGPRCATHHRAARKRAQANAHARTVQKTYGITAEQYQALYELQGRCCFICRRATGRTKRLAVDHDHRTGEVYGLCCGPCNIMLGRYGRRPEPYVRAIEYLLDPPARRALRKPCFVPLTDVTDPASTSRADGAKPTTTDGGEPVIRSD